MTSGGGLGAGALTIGVVNHSSFCKAAYFPALQNTQSDDGFQALRLQLRNAVEGDEGAHSLWDGVAFEPRGF